VNLKTSAAAENRDPMGKPEGPEPWYKQDPWDALDPSSEELELPGIPFGLGLASRSRAPEYDPMTIESALKPPWWLEPWGERQPEDTGPTLEQVLEVPVLGPGSAFPSSTPNPYDLSGGDSALAPPLAWAIGPQRSAFGWDAPDPPRHPQSQIRCSGLVIQVDTELAEIVKLLNRNGISTLSSCCAEESGYGFVMLPLDAAQEFLRFWKGSMKPRGWKLPALSSLELRDASWRAWMERTYPPCVALSVDEHGHTYTTCWIFPAEQLAELRGPLCEALRQALRSRAGGRWSWAASLPGAIRHG
jgi:hypothetical protein